jgi:hypothetical protein
VPFVDLAPSPGPIYPRRQCAGVFVAMFINAALRQLWDKELVQPLIFRFVFGSGLCQEASHGGTHSSGCMPACCTLRLGST